MFRSSIDKTAKHQVVCGPRGVKLTLDAKEIYPDDPGMGTPCLVSFKGETQTLNCALDGNLGEIGCDEGQQDWVNSLYDAADEWLAHHSNGAQLARDFESLRDGRA